MWERRNLSGRPQGSRGGGMRRLVSRQDPIDAPVQVTRGQAQILDLAARDLAVKQIAKILGVSIPTVKTQLQRFYKANGLHSRAGAVALWIGSGKERRRYELKASRSGAIPGGSGSSLNTRNG
jgi:DNA-binding CsgD family transcriptional regulator